MTNDEREVVAAEGCRATLAEIEPRQEGLQGVEQQRRPRPDSSSSSRHIVARSISALAISRRSCEAGAPVAGRVTAGTSSRWLARFIQRL